VIFADVQLQSTDDAAELRGLGLPLRRGVPSSGTAGSQEAQNRALKFRQPCVAFAGCRCRIYPGRPRHCRDFECLLLQSVKAGKTTPGAALRIIRTAHQRAGEVRRLLRELQDTDETMALASRFRRTAKRLERTALAGRQAEIFGQLTLAVHDLNLLIRDHFYPG